MGEEGQIAFNGVGDEMNKVIHTNKSYYGKAFVTIILYYIGFYITGLIANLIFLSQAKRSSQIAGLNPSGRALLRLILIIIART